jgi:hypothetical protein
MKKIYVLSFLLCCANFFAVAQEQVWHEAFLSKAFKISFSNTDNSWVAASIYKQNDTDLPQLSLTKMDLSGNITWVSAPSVLQDYVSVAGMDILEDGHILVAARVDVCDAGLPDTLYLYAPNGALVKSFAYTAGYDIKGVRALAGSNFLVSGNDIVQKMDTSQAVLWSSSAASTNWDETMKTAIAPNGDVFIFSKNEIIKRNGISGQQLNILQTGYYQAVAQLESNFYLVDELRMVAMMDTSFNFGFANFDISNHLDKVYKLEALANGDFLALGKQGNRTRLCRFNGGFALQDTASIDNAHLFINDFATHNNQVAVVGADFSTTASNALHETPFFTPLMVSDFPSGSMAAFFKVLNSNLQGVSSGVDASVTALQYDEAISTFGICAGNDFYNHRVKNLKVTITNNGAVPLDEVTVYTRGDFNCPTYCATFFGFHQTFTNLNLAAGSAITVSLGDIEFPGQAPTNLYDLCLWTGQANNEIDILHSNDQFCSAIQTVNTEKIAAVQPLTIFPNPVANDLHFTLPQAEHPATVQIFDAAGQMVKNEQNLVAPFSLNLATLTEGFYILKCQTTYGSNYLGKFILAR